MKPNIVVLDGGLANPGDLDWGSIARQGQLTVYDQTRPEQIVDRTRNADIVIVNKVRLGPGQFNSLPELKLICLLATGYDNIDIAAARQRGIVVCNAVGYAVSSVAQHVFALVLSVYNRVYEHNASIQKGEWSNREWSYSLTPLRSLEQKTMGIYGFGKIGKKVAAIAQSFDMTVIAHHSHPERDATEKVEFVSLEELFRRSDIVTLHAPLSTSNEKVVNSILLQLMKPGAMLVNTGRGGLINEDQLRSYLIDHPGNMAVLDVLSQEPPSKNHPLLGLENCIITPHNAWASRTARASLIKIVSRNISSFLSGAPTNVVH